MRNIPKPIHVGQVAGERYKYRGLRFAAIALAAYEQRLAESSYLAKIRRGFYSDIPST
jgi:nucleoside diphosphate kinase